MTAAPLLALGALLLLELVARLVLSARFWSFFQKSTLAKEIDRTPNETDEKHNSEVASEKERFKLLDIPAQNLDPLGELPTFSGSWVNVEQGKRVTTDQPLTQSSRVLCLGGSTTFCGDVSDRDTWPSVLQRWLNEAGLHLRVENAGRMGATAINRLKLLHERERLDDVRVVVLLMGVNDAGWVQLRDLVDLPILVRRLISTRFGLTRFAYLVAGRRIGRRVGIAAARKTVVEINAAGNRLSHHKVHFLVALQPHRWIRKRRPNPLVPSISSRFDVRFDFLSALDGAYGVFRDELQKSENVEFLNLEFSLDEMGDSAYVDWVHNSSAGCQTIGRLIGASIERLLSRE